MKLVAFDGDDTLWTPQSGLNLSDRTPTDDAGWPKFSYSPAPEKGVVARNDGALFALRPEAPEVIAALRSRRILVGVISYNHEANVRRIVEAFGLSGEIDYIVAHWHTGKDRMLGQMIGQARGDDHDVRPEDVLLVDDDPSEIYGGQCREMGVHFLRFGVDIHDLREVLGIIGADLWPPDL